MEFVTIAVDACTLCVEYIISATTVSGDDVGMMTRVSADTS